MSQRIATMLIALWTASAAGCSASAPPTADPTPPEPSAQAGSLDPPAAATPEEIDDVGEVRAKRVGSALVGTRAPTPVLGLLGGGALDLGELVGHKPVYLKFWATWCLPCREQMPHFESVQQRFGDEMAVVAVNVGLNETQETVRGFQHEHGLSMPIGYDADGSVAAAFQVEVTPLHVLIDASGSIAYVGHRASEEFDQALAAMLSGDATMARPPRDTEPAPTQPSAQTLDLLDGGSFEVREAARQPTVLSFVATWCDWYLVQSRPAMAKACVAQQERLNELHARLGSRAQFVGVAQSLWTDEGQLREYRKRYGIRFPLALDRGARWFNRFGVHDVPTTIVLDATGTERLRVTGDPAELEAKLESMLAAAAPSR